MAESIVSLPNEIWKPVPEWEGLYWASNLGRIKSAGRAKRWVHEHLVKPVHHHYGYLMVSLKHLGQSKNRFVHVLVAAAFFGQKSEGDQVNHKDGNKHNNRLSNLEYVTVSENNLHRCRVLGHSLGEKNAGAKLTETQVREIRAIGKSTSSFDLAKRYGVSYHAIHKIIKGDTWRHLR